MINKILLSTTLLTSAWFSPALNATTPLLVIHNSDTGTGSADAGDLRYCLNVANTTPGPYNITFALPSGQETIMLSNILPILNVSGSTSAITIDGTNTAGSHVPITINGVGTFPGFIARQGTVTLSNMTILNTLSKGGTGGTMGGGGGAVLVEAYLSIAPMSPSRTSPSPIIEPRGVTATHSLA